MLVRILLVTSFFTAGPRAEVIDRIAATLDNQIITESEIVREIRLTAFLNGDPLDFGPDARKKAADRLIEQKLIRREIELGHYAVPNTEESETMLKQIQTQRFEGPADYSKSLEKYGITEDDLRLHLSWQLTLLRFIDIRFRPAVQITDDEARAYFESERPKLQKAAGPGKQVDFDDYRDQVSETLVNQRVDQQLADWLATTKKRVLIRFHEEAFQ